MSDTLYELFDPGTDDDYSLYYDANYGAQTFTLGTVGTNANHNVTSVKLKIFRVGSPGTVTVSIRATDGASKPTGADLCSGTVDGNALGTGTTGVLTEIVFSSSTLLVASTKYAIVIKAAGANSSNAVGVRQKDAGGYTGGTISQSTDSGSTWANDTPDSVFYEYGIFAGSASPSSSPSHSPSASPSTSPSSSPSPSASPSNSPSTSPSSSTSSSPSSSPSSSASASPSTSPSSSPSPSASPSTSPSWEYNDKHDATWVDNAKHNTNWADNSKHSTNWNNNTKHS